MSITKEQEILVRMMRLDGKSVRDVAEVLKLSEDDVSHVYCAKRYKRSMIGFDTTRHYGLDRWMRHHGMTRVMVADKSGITYSTLCNIMNGDVDVSKKHIDKLLKFTGLTYEEAFGEV
ncbi:MAG: helix-turn-helix transcriptional regulator [Anaerotignum sp.]|nr:helix-turn-helix transcriptional regulator [Anaerotignum sp.]MBR5121934.1 helix-turn-helix transcriptional regulator [Anaerotignum sp.]